MVVVESGNVEKNRQFVERIAAKMQAETNLFRDVFYQQNLAMMGNKALQFATDTNLVEMRDTLRAARPFIEKFTQTTNLVSLFEQINQAFRHRQAGGQRGKPVAGQIAAGAGAHRLAGRECLAAARRAAVAERHHAAGQQRGGDVVQLSHVCPWPDFCGDVPRAE